MTSKEKTISIKLNIQKAILPQFAKQLNISLVNQKITLKSDLGIGQIECFHFPSKLELYHFNFQLNAPVKMSSTNPIGSDWILLNINLSQSSITKKVNNQPITFQKYLPSGILLYTPDTNVQSTSPPSKPFEIVLIRLHKSFLQQYNFENIFLFQNTNKALVYEDLDAKLEYHLQKIIENKQNKIIAHSSLLSFLSIFIKKIQKRDADENYKDLHSDDLKGLFMAATKLRNPLVADLPSINQLSKIAGMGSTKFKTCFKQVFGSPPIQYHQKIKMEYAKDQLESNKKSASEISYDLGYSHPSKFTLAFKKQFGKLPSDF